MRLIVWTALISIYVFSVFCTGNYWLVNNRSSLLFNLRYYLSRLFNFWLEWKWGWGIKVQCIQWILLLFNNIPIVQLTKHFSPQKKLGPLYSEWKTVSLSLTVLNSIWRLTWPLVWLAYYKPDSKKVGTLYKLWIKKECNNLQIS